MEFKKFFVKNKCKFSVDIQPKQEWDRFLLSSRVERMDANRYDLFDKTRCDFHLDRYRFACEYAEEKKIVDCASGTGYGAHLLETLGRAKSIVGIELSDKAVEYANRMYSSDRVSFRQGTILNLPFYDNSVDIFTSFETIEHVEDERRQLEEIYRVLKAGGLYVMSTPNDWESDAIHPYHVRQYDYYSLREKISKKFELLKIYNQNSGTPNRKENRLVSRICGDNQVPATCQVHDIRRFAGISGF
jgi:ubiquinone/menaquinone biosynthesis C-methylase UbiE